MRKVPCCAAPSGCCSALPGGWLQARTLLAAATAVGELLSPSRLGRRLAGRAALMHRGRLDMGRAAVPGGRAAQLTAVHALDRPTMPAERGG